MAEVVPPGVDAAVFNLGWLPGAAHAVTTRVETTLQAVSQAVEPVSYTHLDVYKRQA